MKNGTRMRRITRSIATEEGLDAEFINAWQVCYDNGKVDTLYKEWHTGAMQEWMGNPFHGDHVFVSAMYGNQFPIPRDYGYDAMGAMRKMMQYGADEAAAVAAIITCGEIRKTCARVHTISRQPTGRLRRIIDSIYAVLQLIRMCY